MSEDLKIFKTIDDISNISLKEDSPNRYGFIISPDKCFYLPTGEDKNLHHEQILRFTIMRLYNSNSSIYKSNLEKLGDVDLSELLIDKDEYAISITIAGLGNSIFLNTSSGLFNSGVLFIPKEMNDFQKENVNKFINTLNGFDDMNQFTIARVNTIDHFGENDIVIESWNQDEYKDKENCNGIRIK